MIICHFLLYAQKVITWLDIEKNRLIFSFDSNVHRHFVFSHWRMYLLESTGIVLF